MDIFYRVLLTVHIAAAAVLLGASLGLAGGLKKNLQAARETFLALAKDAARRGMITGVASAVTLSTGVALIFTVGGFGAVPVPIHIALLLMLGAVAVSATILRPSLARAVSLGETEPFDRDQAQASIKKIAMATGIVHLLWIVNLILMLFRHG